MCGITGYIQTASAGADASTTTDGEAILWSMADGLQHRGPDDSGVWFDPATGVGLGHRRLSILDLSPLGHQPMASPSGRYIIVYNGEIYNYQELMQALGSLGCTFRGHSDTEILLNAFEVWGIEPTIRQTVGMFAIALWDRQDRTLILMRDRLGEKPLYYGWAGATFLFGSELKPLRAHPDWRGEIDRGSLALYLRHNYVPAPYSIYQDIWKLQPGSILTLPFATLQPGRLPQPVVYWSAREAVEASLANPFTGSELDAANHLDALLRRSIAGQMIADVPLGAFLSGGVDSSTVVALMQAQSTRPVKTFTIGFHEKAYNEAEHAKAVAAHLQTDHTELYVTPQDTQAVIPNLPTIYDEPFADSSQIPTFLVAQLARRHVTVSLSGDAGDELFAGYSRYAWTNQVWGRLAWLPHPLRSALAGGMMTVSQRQWDFAFAKAGPILPPQLRVHSAGDRIHRFSELLREPKHSDLYRRLISHWKQPERVVMNGREKPTPLTDPSQWAAVDEPTQQMMFWDLVAYLPDDILVKVDRAAMHVSLETRVPFLDHRVVEFAWRLPLDLKVRSGVSKWLLRQVLYRYVPQALIERPKMGFSVPLNEWLRGPLRDWAEDLLDERKLHQQGFLHGAVIQRVWQQHLAGSHDNSYYLWDILMFQAWLTNLQQPATSPVHTTMEQSSAAQR